MSIRRTHVSIILTAILIFSVCVSIPADGAEKSVAIDPCTLKQWSAPYRGWHYYPDHVIPAQPNIKGFEKIHKTDCPTVFQIPGDSKWYLMFIGFDGQGYQSFVAQSDDLVHWTNKRLALGFGKEGEFDFGGRALGAFLYEDYDIKAPRILKKKDGRYWSLYGSYPQQGGYELGSGADGIASSADGLIWQRAKDKPILSVHDADVGDWEKACIYQPWLVEYEKQYYVYYNARGSFEWSKCFEQIGAATSRDLMNWQRYPDSPILRVRPGGFDEKFCADPKVFRDGDHWVMFYFGVGRGGAHIMAAYSQDLFNWGADPEPLYKAGGNPSGLDQKFAHKISLVWNPANETYYMFYNAVGNKGRGIGLITSKPLTKK